MILRQLRRQTRRVWAVCKGVQAKEEYNTPSPPNHPHDYHSFHFSIDCERIEDYIELAEDLESAIASTGLSSQRGGR